MLIYLLIFCELFVDYLPNSVLLLSFLLQETEMEPRPHPKEHPVGGTGVRWLTGGLATLLPKVHPGTFGGQTPRAGSGVLRIDPLPGRMSYKATKPGLVLFYILACFNCIVAYYGPFLCIVNFHWYVFCLLVVLVKLSLLAK